MPEKRECDERGEDDVHAGDEARARDGRPLEPRGLERVPGGEQETEQDPRAHAAPVEPAQSARGRAREREARDREAHGEEGEQRVERDGVLDLDERDAPDRGDRDQREKCLHRAAARSQRRRMSPENGPTTRQ